MKMFTFIIMKRAVEEPSPLGKEGVPQTKHWIFSKISIPGLPANLADLSIPVFGKLSYSSSPAIA